MRSNCSSNASPEIQALERRAAHCKRMYVIARARSDEASMGRHLAEMGCIKRKISDLASSGTQDRMQGVPL